MAPIIFTEAAVWPANEGDFTGSMVLMDGFSHGVDNPTNGWSGRGVEAGGHYGSIDRKHHPDGRFSSSDELVKAAQVHSSDNHGDALAQIGPGLNCATPFLEDAMFDGLLTGDAAIHDSAAWADPPLRFAEDFFPSSEYDGIRDNLFQPDIFHTPDPAAAGISLTKGLHQSPPSGEPEQEAEIQNQGRNKKTLAPQVAQGSTGNANELQRLLQRIGQGPGQGDAQRLIEYLHLLQQQQQLQQLQQVQQPPQQQQQQQAQQEAAQQQYRNGQQQQRRGEAAQQEAASKRPLVDSAFHREFEFDSLPAMRAAESRALERALTAADRAAAAQVDSAGVSLRGAAEPAAAAAPFLAGMGADSGGMEGVVGMTGGTAGWASATDADMVTQLLANSRKPLATDMDMVSQVRLRMDPSLLASLDAMRAHSQHHAQLHALQGIFGCTEDVRAVHAPSASDAELRARLLRLAEAVATSEQGEMAALTRVLRADATPHGTPMQRVVHYLLGALGKRASGSLGEEYVVEPLQTAEEEALILAFAARNPLMQHCYTTMACGIVDAVEHDPRVHIVDFAMWGGQWPVVIRQLAASAARRRRESCTHGCTAAGAADPYGASSSGSRSSGNSNSNGSGACPTCTGSLPLHIRYTAIEPPPGHPWGAGPKIPIPFLQAEVCGAAAECGVALSFHRVEARPETLRPLMLGIERGEAVVVNCAGRLANLADSTVLRSSPKDTALSTILQLAPKVVTIVEWDANHRQPFFLHRFRDCLDFFSNVFHSHEHLASRASFGRRGFEERVLAREMINLVACEGLQRLVRAETLDQLHERMQRVGFAPKAFSRRSMAALGQMLAPYSKGFSVVSHPLGGVQLLWQGKSMLGASFWQPAVEGAAFG
ncbi:unnamed protein product [Closterium sp. Yama58-4]|nr:unnamed protein product [Closterium sp. Yama58-4]